jgi:hypothetical protein
MERFDGTKLLDEVEVTVPRKGAIELDLCSNETEQAYGEILFEAGAGNVLNAEVIRKNATGTIELGGPLLPSLAIP